MSAAGDFLIDCCATWLAVKQDACARAAGPAPLTLQLDVRLADGSRHFGLLPEREDLIAAVRRVEAAAGDIPAEAVAVLADAYVMPAEPGAVRGDAERAFQAGDLRVREMLTVTVGTRDHRLVGASIPYHYDDRGWPVFDPPAIQDGRELRGAIPALLQLVFV